MLKGTLKITLIFVFFIVLNLSTQSQNRKYFIITGKIISETTEFTDAATIQITKKDKPAVSTSIPQHGRFRLELDYNSEYKLTFTKSGSLPKTIVVNTEIPQEVVDRPTNFPHFLMAIKLSTGNQQESNFYYQSQQQYITYSTREDCFEKIPTVSEIGYVEKSIQNQALSVKLQESKSKIQTYQVF
jgi:hypothetical protein